MERCAMKRVLVMVLVLGWAGWCMGSDAHHEPAETGAPAPHANQTHHAEANPTVAHQPKWAGTLVAVIGVMFAAAIVAGLLVRPTPAEEPPDSHGHGDAHGGADDGHGHGHAGHH